MIVMIVSVIVSVPVRQYVYNNKYIYSQLIVCLCMAVFCVR